MQKSNKDHWEQLDAGDKLILPPSAFNEAARIRLPMARGVVLRVENERSRTRGLIPGRDGVLPEKVQQFSGVYEFSAPEGLCYVPAPVMHSIGARPGSKVLLTSVKNPPKGQFAKFQPETTAFIDLAAAFGPRELMEQAMKHYSVLSKGQVLDVRAAGEAHRLEVLEVRPGTSVSLYGDLDLEVDFAPPKDMPEQGGMRRRRPSSARDTRTGAGAGTGAGVGRGTGREGRAIAGDGNGHTETFNDEGEVAIRGNSKGAAGSSVGGSVVDDDIDVSGMGSAAHPFQGAGRAVGARLNPRSGEVMRGSAGQGIGAGAALSKEASRLRDLAMERQRRLASVRRKNKNEGKGKGKDAGKIHDGSQPKAGVDASIAGGASQYPSNDSTLMPIVGHRVGEDTSSHNRGMPIQDHAEASKRRETLAQLRNLRIKRKGAPMPRSGSESERNGTSGTGHLVLSKAALESMRTHLNIIRDLAVQVPGQKSPSNPLWVRQQLRIRSLKGRIDMLETHLQSTDAERSILGMDFESRARTMASVSSRDAAACNGLVATAMASEQRAQSELTGASRSLQAAGSGSGSLVASSATHGKTVQVARFEGSQDDAQGGNRANTLVRAAMGDPFNPQHHGQTYLDPDGAHTGAFIQSGPGAWTETEGETRNLQAFPDSLAVQHGLMARSTTNGDAPSFRPDRESPMQSTLPPDESTNGVRSPRVARSVRGRDAHTEDASPGPLRQPLNRPGVRARGPVTARPLLDFASPAHVTARGRNARDSRGGAGTGAPGGTGAASDSPGEGSSDMWGDPGEAELAERVYARVKATKDVIRAASEAGMRLDGSTATQSAMLAAAIEASLRSSPPSRIGTRLGGRGRGRAQGARGVRRPMVSHEARASLSSPSSSSRKQEKKATASSGRHAIGRNTSGNAVGNSGNKVALPRGQQEGSTGFRARLAAGRMEGKARIGSRPGSRPGSAGGRGRGRIGNLPSGTPGSNASGSATARARHDNPVGGARDPSDGSIALQGRSRGGGGGGNRLPVRATLEAPQAGTESGSQNASWRERARAQRPVSGQGQPRVTPSGPFSSSSHYKSMGPSSSTSSSPSRECGTGRGSREGGRGRDRGSGSVRRPMTPQGEDRALQAALLASMGGARALHASAQQGGHGDGVQDEDAMLQAAMRASMGQDGASHGGAGRAQGGTARAVSGPGRRPSAPSGPKLRVGSSGSSSSSSRSSGTGRVLGVGRTGGSLTSRRRQPASKPGSDAATTQAKGN